MSTMNMRRDDAAHADRLVLEFVRAHTHTTMDTLVRAMVTLSWAQVFSAVDRLSRAHKVILEQTPNRDYTLRMHDPFIPAHVMTQVIRAKGSVRSKDHGHHRQA